MATVSSIALVSSGALSTLPNGWGYLSFAPLLPLLAVFLWLRRRFQRAETSQGARRG